MEKRLLVFGDRNWDDPWTIFNEIQRRNPDVVISGRARGADTQAEIAANQLRIPFLPFEANWKMFGRAAGPIRNQQMLDEGQPTEAVGFHHDISKSKGSKDMYKRCQKASIPVEIIG